MTSVLRKVRSYFGYVFGFFVVLVIVREAFFIDRGVSPAKQRKSPSQMRDEMKQRFPCMAVDGEARRIEVEWLLNELRITLPKAYGPNATRFVQSAASVPKDRVCAATREGEHVFLSLSVRVYDRSSLANELSMRTIQSSQLVAIPISLIPEDFKPTQKPSGQPQSGPEAPAAPG